jgi:hypothetical protein
MKRDMDLIRELLLKIESLEIRQGETLFFNVHGLQVQGYGPDQVVYNIELLFDAGFLKGQGGADTFGIAGLTWSGHELLDDIRDPEIWRKTKSGRKPLPAWACNSYGRSPKPKSRPSWVSHERTRPDHLAQSAGVGCRHRRPCRRALPRIFRGQYPHTRRAYARAADEILGLVRERRRYRRSPRSSRCTSPPESRPERASSPRRASSNGSPQSATYSIGLSPARSCRSTRQRQCAGPGAS